MNSAARFRHHAVGQTLCALTASLFVALGAAASDLPPIFDAHLHYNDEATAVYPVTEVLKRIRDNGVATILATSRPNDGTRALLSAARADPRETPRVVPFVRPYRTHADVGTWFNDPEIYTLVESELRRDVGYQGIGEFHVFGNDAGGIWVKRIVALAVERNLWLHAHCDDAALEILFGHDPGARIIWAHTGFTTPPAKIARYMERYPNLVGELSFRYDITDGGKIAPAWRALFLAYPDRFVAFGPPSTAAGINTPDHAYYRAGFASCRLMSRRRSPKGERVLAAALDR
jgi:hypothetical protein